MNQMAQIGDVETSTPLPRPLPTNECEARERLIVALDVSDVDKAETIVKELGDRVAFYKIGLELQFDGGIRLARDLTEKGFRVFLDTKLLDVGNTVERAVENIIHKVDAAYITVHVYRHAIAAAVKAKKETNGGNSKLKILGVTVLTSMDERDLKQIVQDASLPEVVVQRAVIAHELGADGVIASGQEAALIRKTIDDDRFTIMTPAIRLPSDDPNEQKRITTPRVALENGSDYLVVGRPITQSSDRRGAVDRIIANMLGV